jgi:gamma-glutamyltranspeptidase/glutathione hydrolase
MPDVPLGPRPVYAPRGAVATSQPLAASAGVAVLRRGGNAVDAAVATAITLTVVQPGANDLGGDLFALVWDGSARRDDRSLRGPQSRAGGGRLHGLNASGRSPAALTRELVLSRLASSAGARAAGEPAAALGGAQAAAGVTVPARGWLPVTVPGAPAGWRELHARFGVLPFEELFTDAIGYARDGYPVSPSVARGWARAVTDIHRTLRGPEFQEWGRVFAPGGRAPRAGERFRNPDAARTLRAIAESSAEAFYTGPVADAVAGFAAATGGLLTAADLAGHRCDWVDPIGTDYRGHQVWELPPNGQGLAALIALNILEGYPPGGGTLEERLHRRIEAVKLGFADAHGYVADPELAPAPVRALLDKGYAAARRALVGERAGDPAPGDPLRGGTVYVCTADAGGMMVSLIQSNYMGFGSHVVAPGTGFGLQNRGAGFVLDPSHPNVVAPGKRPYHTIIPGFLTRDGGRRAVGPFGVIGGHMQPQGHVQLVLATVDEGLDPQSALNAPRWYWHTGRQVRLEPELAGQAEALRRRGHEVTIDGERAGFGYGQAIWRLPDGDGYVAGSEPRADGCAIGY